jgi:Flp pilus assembly protein TadG
LPWANRARRSIAALGRSAADERGAEVVEGIGMFLLLLMMGLIIWQFMIIGHQMIVVADAARHGARSAAAHRNCLLAVEESVLPQNFSTLPSCESCSGSGDPVKAKVTLWTPTVFLPTASGAWQRIVGFDPCGVFGRICFKTQAIFRCEPE